jgi:hypothetical protein
VLVTLAFNNSQNTPSLSSIAFPKNTSDLSLLDLFVLVGPANYSFSAVQIPAFASERLLNVFLQSYTASSTNGAFHESPTGPPEILSKPSVDSGPLSSGKFLFQYEAVKVLEIYLGDTFSGSVKEANSRGGTVAFPDAVSQALFLAMNSTTYSLDGLMGNVATSMTRNMRTRSDAGTPAMGHASSMQTFVHIEWAWISLPLVVLFGVLGFLLVVIARTRSHRIPIWKDSSLATLFHGIDFEGRARIGDGETLDEAAEGLLASVEQHEDGWGLRRG